MLRANMSAVLLLLLHGLIKCFFLDQNLVPMVVSSCVAILLNLVLIYETLVTMSDMYIRSSYPTHISTEQYVYAVLRLYTKVFKIVLLMISCVACIHFVLFWLPQI